MSEDSGQPGVDSGKDDSLTPADAVASLRTRVRTVHLSTLDDDGAPHASYAPYCEHDGELLIFISQLSKHTRHLLARPGVSVMLIEDEADARQMFARLRVVYQCEAVAVAADDPARDQLLDKLQSRQGKMIGLLRQLGDFVLFRLKPEHGMLVMGFGQAYRWNKANPGQYEHVQSA